MKEFLQRVKTEALLSRQESINAVLKCLHNWI